jgi:hypothetical protein
VAKSAYLYFIILILVPFVFVGCGGGSSASSGGGSSVIVTPEEAVCNTNQISSGSTTTVNGTALYSDRNPTHNASNVVSETPTNKPIQFAEVWILNAANQRVQCGATDSSGYFSLTIPTTSDIYTVAILSRSDSSAYKARVLSDPIDNYLYSVESTFSGDGNPKSLGNIIASYTDASVTAGAFNILDQVRIANSELDAAATTFTAPAPSIPIFWTAGESPAQYFNEPSVAVSFYLNAASGNLQRGLYILGGIQTEKNCADTDHFDDSVILHEYAHYLEDQYSGSDSPGGSHNGNMIIDPRLAWSEGWANFFQGFARNSGDYNDYFGNMSCGGSSPAVGITLNLATMTNHQDKMPPNYTASGVNYTLSPYFYSYDAADLSAITGEGVFREVSISRHLYDVEAGDGMDQIWRIFDDETVGMGSSSTKYRNVGMFNYLYNAYSATTAMTNSASAESQTLTRAHYAAPLTVGTCTLSMKPVNKIGDGSGSTSIHLHQSADFYEYTYNGSSGATITLDNLGSENLDLRIYSSEHTLFTTEGLVGSSTNNSASSDEVVSLAGQPSGKYLIVVYAGSTTTSSTHSSSNYTLSNGSQLCP